MRKSAAVREFECFISISHTQIAAYTEEILNTHEWLCGLRSASRNFRPHMIICAAVEKICSI